MSKLLALVCALPLSLGAVIPVFAADMPTAEAKAHAEFPDISKAELDKAIADKQVVLIDCNGSESYAKGHIPGAINFAAHPDLTSRLPAAKDALVVAYCGGPACGAYKEGAEAAKKLGYTNVKHFSAGISGWKSAGGPVDN